MKNPSDDRPRISGTRFIDADSEPRARFSLSASYRDQHHPVTGTGGDPNFGAIDTPVDESCVVCAPATRRLAEELFERWNDALKTGDADRVTDCYAEDAVLLPTVSNVPRTTRDEIRDYFRHFLEKRPEGTINQRNVKFGCNKLTDAGTYTFRVRDGGEVREVPARYTFVYENRDGEWKIVHHHSSMMPGND
ncbi:MULTISPECIES: SgcJ/EcaC family oxidoreductase [unclassified Thioalkalivibrio]|uniref:SgcJ/EcaC family oxidoreductase n=1 Tax=unclassified Thioalkalivibrio TaxID=2621013 RepID=UPI00036D9015|nr:MULTISPECIES: SgcJ/EcaC family oxidoreductase [unclassified Thioalkalivibrio]